MLTADDLKQARELCEKATPGEWFVENLFGVYFGCEDYQIANTLCTGITEEGCEENAKFIAASRTLIPKLLDHIEALQKENERLKGICNGYKLWGTDDCSTCADGRVSLFIWNTECIECSPESYMNRTGVKDEVK